MLKDSPVKAYENLKNKTKIFLKKLYFHSSGR